MKPNRKFINISNNLTNIKHVLHELVLVPRLNAIKWFSITKQTAHIKIGYPGQHIASLITGMEGERTGARGNDLIDGSEVKSCSRIDQLDICRDCKAPVARLERYCTKCGSSNIFRKNDSKWIFSIRNEDELDLLLHKVKRVLLLIGDYLNFDKGDFETLRFQSFEIWSESLRNSRFSEIMTNYYYKIYLEHKKRNSYKNPAPKNFWPYSYQFYICNPILTFCCIVHHANTKPEIEVKHYVKPHIDRSNIQSVLMPVEILKERELELIIKKAPKRELQNMIKTAFLKKNKSPNFKHLTFREKQQIFTGIDEKLRKYLSLRDTNRISTTKRKYTRRKTT